MNTHDPVDLRVKQLPKRVKNDLYTGQYGLRNTDGRWLVDEETSEPLAYSSPLAATKKRRALYGMTVEQLNASHIILMAEADLTIADHSKPQELPFPEHRDWLRDIQIIEIHADGTEELKEGVELLF